MKAIEHRNGVMQSLEKLNQDNDDNINYNNNNNNNNNKTYLCRMTISVIKTAIKEKKIKLGVISI